uniref:39S ribosomal protein L51, mitochondrial n=1 Tax=Strongyloides papillosus TaxID=174720 RepID=A0A0N5CIL9_STREA
MYEVVNFRATYGAQAWQLLKNTPKQLQGTINHIWKCLNNNDINTSKLPSVEDKILKLQLRFMGHQIRKKDGLAKRMVEGIWVYKNKPLVGKRSVGRPQK